MTSSFETLYIQESSELEEVKIDTASLESAPPSWKSPYNTECPCCLEIPKQGRVIMDCRHLLCVNCFIKHTRNSKECPVCRSDIHNISFPSRSARLSALGQTIMNNEINRRLQHHIDEVNSIRRNLPLPRQSRNNQLRNAPPLAAQRNIQDRNGRMIYEGRDFILDDRDNTHMTSRQYIMITAFTIVDILIMLLWLHAINTNHTNHPKN